MRETNMSAAIIEAEIRKTFDIADGHMQKLDVDDDIRRHAYTCAAYQAIFALKGMGILLIPPHKDD